MLFKEYVPGKTGGSSPSFHSLRLQSPGTLSLESIGFLETHHFPFKQLTTLDIFMGIDVAGFYHLMSLVPLLTTVKVNGLVGEINPGAVEAVELLHL